jgi:hypothetical protein
MNSKCESTAVIKKINILISVITSLLLPSLVNFITLSTLARLEGQQLRCGFLFFFD